MIIDEGGLWCEIDYAGSADGPALFLDRDGVIVADTRYLGRPEDLRMIQGAAAAIAQCNALEIPVVLVTNQSGIARGYYDWNSFRNVQVAMSEALAAAGAHIDAVLACAYHADGRAPLRIADHPWRKPNPGMILEAARRMGVDLSRSWIVGDTVSDLVAGKTAGLMGGTLIISEDQDGQQARLLANRHFVVETAASLADAVALLLARKRFSS
jgi:D-glycero-D-manno-heptose 1,7-bisphosphate phosphatase